MSNTWKSKSYHILILLTVLFSGPAWAETLRIGGIYPAGDPDVAGVKSISISNILGSDGDALAAEVEAQLTSVVLNNEQYFTVIAPGGGRADANLSGNVKITVEPSQVVQSQRVCVVENYKGKCVQYETQKVRCDRRVIVFTATARLTRTTTKQLLYSATKPDKRDIIECPDGSIGETNEEAVAIMIKAAASSMRYDLAPTYREERVRLVEDDEGLDKELAKRFKSAIKLTKKNEDKACEALQALRGLSQDNISIIYNVALCAEKQNKFSEATLLYRQIQPNFPNKDFIDVGLKRVSDKQRAQIEWARRNTPIQKKK